MDKNSLVLMIKNKIPASLWRKNKIPFTSNSKQKRALQRFWSKMSAVI